MQEFEKRIGQQWITHAGASTTVPLGQYSASPHTARLHERENRHLDADSGLTRTNAGDRAPWWQRHRRSAMCRSPRDKLYRVRGYPTVRMATRVPDVLKQVGVERFPRAPRGRSPHTRADGQSAYPTEPKTKRHSGNRDHGGCGGEMSLPPLYPLCLPPGCFRRDAREETE